MYGDLSIKLTAIGYRLLCIGNHSNYSIRNHQEDSYIIFLRTIRTDSATHLFYLGFAFYHRCGTLHTPQDTEIQFFNPGFLALGMGLYVPVTGSG